ncbi:MAG TPA: transposase [Ktedonobacteraceae bacterium]|nr:transposase [Ktedonobacteraceae bacterium]
MGKAQYDPNIHHRRSIRLQNYNYASKKSYFVTICTQGRLPCFEQPALRTILEETWHTLPERFAGLVLDEYVIMPDHVHFIVQLSASASKHITLGQVVGAYKSLTSVKWLKHIEMTGLNEQGKFWQRNYIERVICDEDELARIREYIRNNPLRSVLKKDGSENLMG